MKKCARAMLSWLLVLAIVMSLGIMYVAAEESGAIVVNVRGEGYTETGSGWIDSSLFSYDGTTKTRYTPTLGGTATWTATIEKAGDYEVYFWQVAGKYASKLYLDYTGGSQQIVNWNTTQTAGWFKLGEATYGAGQSVSVTLSNPEGGDMRAAAVQFVPKTETEPSEEKLLVNVTDMDYYQEVVGTWSTSSAAKGYGGGNTRYSLSQDAEVEWNPVVTEAGTYQVRLYHPVHSTDVLNSVTITVTDSEGKVLYHEDQTWGVDDQSRWINLGTYDEIPEGSVTVRVKKNGTVENPNNPGYYDQALRAAEVQLVKGGSQKPENVDPFLINVRDANRYIESGGGWTDSSLKSCDGETLTRYSFSQGASATWSTTIPEAATYKVSIWRLNAAYTDSLKVSYTGGEDQTLAWGEMPQAAGWVEIGTASYQAGEAVSVTLSIPNGGTVRASAVKLEPVVELTQREKATYYVDSAGGDDGNVGTSPEAAWKTFENVNLSEFAPGSQILLKAGGSWTGQLAPNGSGTAENPIVIDMYGQGDKPCIDGNGLENTGVVYLCNQEYWEIKNLEVTDSAAEAAVRYGILVELQNYNDTADHIYVQNCNIHDIVGKMDNPHNGVGIFFYAPNSSDTAKFHDILIDRNTVKNVDRSGIIIRTQDTTNYSTGVVIQNNYLESIGGDGIVPKLCNGALVQYNECNGAAARATGGNVNNAALWAWQCDNALFQYNEVYNTGLLGGNKDGQAFDSDFNNRNCVFQYNYSHDNDGGFMLLIAPSGGSYNEGTIVRYNISQNDKKDIFEISGEVKDAQIYNNTIYVDDSSDAKMLRVNTYWGISKSAAFTNNIFFSANTRSFMEDNDNGRPLRGEGLVFDCNAFYGMTPPETVDQEVDVTVGSTHYTGKWQVTVTNSVTENPKLVQPGSGGTGIDFTLPNQLPGYQLAAGSPCINAGVQLTTDVLDFGGNQITGIPDVGAYEFLTSAGEPDVPSAPAVTVRPNTSQNASTQKVFADVSEHDWYYDAVEYVYAQGIMHGIDEMHFSPDAEMTRAMFVTVLHRTAGSMEATQAAPFRDVPSDSYYAEAVAWAAENGIVSGVSAEKFAPNEKLTREQMVTILYRYFLYEGLLEPVVPDFSGWPDAADVSEYARAAMTWAVKTGVVNGVGNQILAPKQIATRGQIAAIMMRLCENVLKNH